MPHTTSAWKRLRQTEKRRRRNRTWVKSIKKETRDVTDALKAGDPAKVQSEFVEASQKLDKAAAHGIIHPNKAARLKSRMAKKVNAAAKAPPKVAGAK